MTARMNEDGPYGTPHLGNEAPCAAEAGRGDLDPTFNHARPA